jgi:hypothetical protein
VLPPSFSLPQRPFLPLCPPELPLTLSASTPIKKLSALAWWNGLPAADPG